MARVILDTCACGWIQEFTLHIKPFVPELNVWCDWQETEN